jgi:S1-C subfamily serine protease
MRNLLVLVVLLFSSCVHTPPVSDVDRPIQSSVQVVVPDGFCSGVIVSDTQVLTAAHCTELGGIALVFSWDQTRTCIAKTTKLDSDKDLALMSLDSHCSPLGPSARVSSWTPPVGSLVVAIGFPAGIHCPIATDGRASSVVPGDANSVAKGRMVVSAPVFGGNSGGGVWWEGMLVGIVSEVISEYHHVAIAVSLDDIREFLKQ